MGGVELLLLLLAEIACLLSEVELWASIDDIAISPNAKWYAQTGTGGIYTAKGDPAKWIAYEVRDGVRMRVIC